MTILNSCVESTVGNVCDILVAAGTVSLGVGYRVIGRAVDHKLVALADAAIDGKTRIVAVIEGPGEVGFPAKTTPGVKFDSMNGFRPFSGNSVTRRFSITPPRVAVDSSSSGGAAVTVTDSATSPT